MQPLAYFNKANHTYGLAKTCKCYFSWLLESDEGKIKVEKSILKATKDRRELESEEIKTKSRSKLTTALNTTKNYVHSFVHKRDKGMPCAACGCLYSSSMDASHYYKAELFSSLKFNIDNIHLCCIKCNRMNDGNLSEYAVRLPLIIGEERFKELNRLASIDKVGNFKWDIEELNRIRKEIKSFD